MEFLDTLASWGDTAAKVINNPLTQIAVGAYQNSRNKKAINSATQTQQQANRLASRNLAKFYGKAMNELRGAYSEGKTSLLPYYTAGTEGLGRYNALLADPSILADRADYQFGLDQGLEAVDRRMAGSGYRRSGNRAIALNDYAQGYANQYLDNVLARELQLANIGQSSTNTLANMGYNYSKGISNLYGDQGKNEAGLNIDYGDVTATGSLANAQQQRNLFSDILTAADWWDTANTAKKS